MVVAACSSASVPDTTADPGPPPSVESTISTSVPTTTAITTTSTEPTTTVPTADGERGLAGIGDPFYPELGNGGYDVSHYQLNLDIDPEEGSLQGTATISAVALSDLSAFNLDLVGLEVSGVRVNGVEAVVLRDGREMTVTPETRLDAGRPFEVEIEYGGKPVTSTAVPFGSGWVHRDQLIYVIDEPDGASTWFPANDHPRDPATFGINLTVPAGYETVTSGVAVGGLDDPDLPDRWEIPEPTAPYLVALAVGDFVRTEQRPVDGVELTLWHPPGLDPRLLAPFDSHQAMISYYAELFGDYPFDRYGALVIDDPGLAAALETQTLSTFGILTLNLGEQVVAHELAHQWFGDSVRLDTWNDIWLNEGLATFAQWLWVEQANGPAAYDESVVDAYRLMSGENFGEGGAAEARRRFPPPAHPSPDDLFNPSVYLRGGLALVAVRDEVGDDVMWKILTEWHRRFGGSVATSQNFKDLVAELGGPEALSILTGHLESPLVPPLAVDRKKIPN